MNLSLTPFRGFLIACLLAPFTLRAQLDRLMPVPTQIVAGSGNYSLNSSFQARCNHKADSRLGKAVQRFLWEIDKRSGLLISKDLQTGDMSSKKKSSGLNVYAAREGKLEPGEKEDYRLTITPGSLQIEAETDLGAMHALNTLSQLLSQNKEGFYFPACEISDAPRFTWRGLLMDVCRHWMPLEVVKRNLDAMDAVKMNVLHLHLSEDQGFRVESKTHPKLHEQGSNGNYFSHEDIKEIVAYAADRGIRVMPEFDLPGHATSWLVGYPELASAPGPYQIEKKFGVFDPTFNPAIEETYTFLEAFFTEMAALFPDPWFHIGGDENNGKQWDSNPEIQAFMKKKGFADNHALQAYFNGRLLEILQKLDKKMIGWDEIYQAGISKEIGIQSWRGKEALYAAAQAGYPVILSNGWYIDLCRPAAHHYLNDPLPEGHPLNEQETAFVLGGEATMWAELVTPETVDSRIWPRTAAIAERLWSPSTVKDLKDLYRRLDYISQHLDGLGLTHLRNRETMLRRLCQGEDHEPLRLLSDYSEPLEVYNRHHQGVAYSTDLPFTRFPDVCLPDAPGIIRLQRLIDQALSEPSPTSEAALREVFQCWSDNTKDFQVLVAKAPNLSPLLPNALNLGSLGDFCLKHYPNTLKFSKAEQQELIDLLEQLKKPVFEAEIVVGPAIEKLFGMK